MMTASRISFAVLLAFATFFLTSSNARGQVLEATLYGIVQDSSGGILPGVTVTVTHQGTTLTRDTVSDARGEFALPALPPGPYTIKIELSGFKTYENKGLTLSAGQTVRQTFALEVGTLAETVTVAENAPLIETATTAQVQSLGEEVREIPVSRRNLQNVILLGSGVSSPDSSVGGRPGVPRQRRRRRRQRHHGGRQQRPDQPGKPRLRQLRRPEPDRDPECRSGRRGAGGQGRPAGGVRRLDRRSGQHDHAFGDEPVPRIAV